MCEDCADNQYTREWLGVKQRCYTCGNGTWPDPETRTKCEAIDPTYMRWNDILGVTLCILATLGLLIGATTMVVFIINNNDPLIKASSRELSYFMLVAILINFAVVYSFLIKPSDSVSWLFYSVSSIAKNL